MGLQSEVSLPENEKITLRSLLQHLISRHGERVRHRMFVRDEMAPYITVTINGNPVTLAECLDHPLRDGDQVNLLSAIVAGG